MFFCSKSLSWASTQNVQFSLDFGSCSLCVNYDIYATTSFSYGSLWSKAVRTIGEAARQAFANSWVKLKEQRTLLEIDTSSAWPDVGIMWSKSCPKHFTQNSGHTVLYTQRLPLATKHVVNSKCSVLIPLKVAKYLGHGFDENLSQVSVERYSQIMD